MAPRLCKGDLRFRPMVSPIATTLWEVTIAAMTTINFCSKFIVHGEGVSFGTPVVANVARRSGKR